MIREEEVFRIGQIGKPHGIKGEVMMRIDDDVFDRVEADYVVILVDGILVPFFMEEYRFRSDESVQVKFEGIDSQEQARELTNCQVFFPYSLSDDDEDQPSWNRLVGMTLIDGDSGERVGRVTGIDQQTINILLEVDTPNGEILVPAADELVTHVDWKLRELHIRLPEGLLSLHEQ